MALTPPTIQELETFRNAGAFAAAEVDYVESVMQQATDAIWATTGLEDEPSDPRGQRLLNYAIMQFTLWLMSQDEHRDEINSPYSSERIGSYSYSKMQGALDGTQTGIFWLDMLFRYLGFFGDDPSLMSWSSSENVMNPSGLTYAEQESVELSERFIDFFGR